nr:TrkH family potassium uptake protein [Natroniella sulfidigena]
MSGILLIPVSINLFYQEGLTDAFLIPALISLGIGLVSKWGVVEGRLSLTTGMLICSLSWIVISILGALPFYLALDYSYVNSLFEAVSGFTAAGLTVFTGLEELPRSILFWRGLMQWLGGLGFLTFFLVITFKGQAGLFQLFTAEAHKIELSRPVPNIFKTIKILWGIYIFFTLLLIISLYLLGVSFFDSVVHGFTTVATGGFSNYDNSIAYFQEAGYSNYKAIEYVIILFMLLGGMNFVVHYKLLTGQVRELWAGIEMKLFWGFILGGTALVLVSHYSYFPFVWEQLEEVVRKSLFQVVALLTTTGYATESIGSSFFPALAQQFFLILMLIGGCVGSTAGGFKIMRVAILGRLFQREVKKISYPQGAVIPVVVDGGRLANSEVFRVVALFISGMFLLMVGGLITALFSDLPAWNAFSGIFSALGTIGPSYIEVEQLKNLSDIIKINYIIAMLAGRLEILPLFILFNKQAWSR